MKLFCSLITSYKGFLKEELIELVKNILKIRQE